MVSESNSMETLKKDLTEYLEHAFTNEAKQLVPEGTTVENLISTQMKAIATPWMVFFMKHDPAPVLEKVSCAVLALNGEKDLQVPPKENLTAIAQALQKGGNKNVKTIELPDLNHLFQESKTGVPSEYGAIEQTFAPIALKTISDWILEAVK